MASPASGAVDFAPHVDYLIDDSANAVEATDADHDQDKDLIGIGNTEVTLSLNAGDGTFGTPSSIGRAVQPGRGLAIGRFNRGRAEDIAVVDDRFDPSRVAILISNGDGSFRKPKLYRAGGGPTELAVGDFDDDGNRDLAASSSAVERLAILFGRGNGTFTMGRRVDVDDNTQEIAAGDLNGDGRTDLAAVNAFNDVSIAYGRSGRSFRVGPDLTAGTDPFAVEIADLDGDGRRDVVVTNSVSGSNAYVSVAWKKRRGFASPTDFSLNQITAPQSVAVGELSGGGLLDVATGNYGGSVSVLENQGGRAFASPVAFAVDSGVQDVEAATLDANDSLDLVTANDNDDDASVLLNQIP